MDDEEASGAIGRSVDRLLGTNTVLSEVWRGRLALTPDSGLKPDSPEGSNS